jgi:uncharacterized protein (TIGR02145 family)
MKRGIWIYSFVILVALLMITYRCKKSNDDTSKNNNTTNETGTATDADGNLYKTVKIGTQWWMAENLRTTRYNDSTSILLITDSATWGTLTTPAYCWYNNNPGTYKKSYGALYNWFAVNTGKLAPKGWHVPAETEWNILIGYLGGNLVAGGKMKESGTLHWESPNTGADNSSGFSALPGGARLSFGWYVSLGRYGFWWSVNDSIGGCTADRPLAYQSPEIWYDYSPKVHGYSVRCVKDH